MIPQSLLGIAIANAIDSGELFKTPDKKKKGQGIKQLLDFFLKGDGAQLDFGSNSQSAKPGSLLLPNKNQRRKRKEVTNPLTEMKSLLGIGG